MTNVAIQPWQEAVAEVWQLFRETDARLDTQFKQMRHEFNEELKQSQAKFDADLARSRSEFDADLKQSRAEFDKRINKLSGLFGQQWGKLVEVLIQLDVVDTFQARGINVDMVTPRVKRTRGHETIEIDILLLNTVELVVVETKSSPTIEDVNDFLTDLADFKRFFTEYRTYQVYGAIAGLDIPTEVSRYAYRKGLFVLAVTGRDMVTVKNDDKFVPKNFG